MAGNQAEFNNYLRDVLTLPDPVCRALNAHGISGLADFKSMKELQSIQDLCKNIRSPGGSIPNPRAAEAGQPLTLPDRGHQVGIVVQNKLEMLWWFVQYVYTVQREPTRALATMEALETTWDYKLTVERLTKNPPSTSTFV